MPKLYNTLTRKKDDFKPLRDSEVKIYSCGPTVYDYAHIGNLRTYIFTDILRRTLELAGYKVKEVMNITDVGHLTSDEDTGEDKIEKEARLEKKSPQAIAKFYTEAFNSDLKDLNIESPEIMPKATDHIKEMIAIIEKIIARGYGYVLEDGIYFNTKKLSNFGALSRQKIQLPRVSRLDKIKGKKNPTDFALWLKAVGKNKNHLMQWDSPWGKGFPGWHIECSAMSQKYLGKVFDIHTGGVDHIPIHHENEIAQSVAATGKVPARFWLHGEFLQVSNDKMAKSRNNFITLSDLKKNGFDPIVFRFLVLRNHYRSLINFSYNKMKEAETALFFLRASINRLKSGENKTVVAESSALAKKIKSAKKQIADSFFDDLNTPQAIDVIFEFTHYLNKLKTKNLAGAAEIQHAVAEIYDYADKVLAVNLVQRGKGREIPKEILKLVEERTEARNQADFVRADQIRKEIESKGYMIEDEADGKGYKIIAK